MDEIERNSKFKDDFEIKNQVRKSIKRLIEEENWSWSYFGLKIKN